MILQSAFDDVRTLALFDATAFRKRYMTASDFFDQDKPDKSGYAHVISSLTFFIRNTQQVLIHHLEYDDVPGFASWLVKTGDGRGGIALYINQMAAWQAKTRMPLHVQMIRSIVHELGHIRMSPHLLRDTPRPATGLKRSKYATPKEEEMAWIYTFIFLGIILGDYSFESRTQNAVDDAPRFFL